MLKKDVLIELNNGVMMPQLGLGTWPMKKALYKTVPLAYCLGYRSLDTASAYHNELYLGRVLRFLPRKTIFVTSKLSNAGQRSGDVRTELMMSLERLRFSYIDLYLMHWPNPDTYLNCWKQMEKIHKEGLARSIGVCNFHEHHLKNLLDVADIVPSVNQIELHPLLTQQALVEYCVSKDIAIEAYSPLARMDCKLIEHPVLKALGIKYQKTVPQIVLRWIVQSGHVTCPKTSSYARLKQNISIFDFKLSDDEMNRVSGLNENYRVRHNPDTADFSKL